MQIRAYWVMIFVCLCVCNGGVALCVLYFRLLPVTKSIFSRLDSSMTFYVCQKNLADILPTPLFANKNNYQILTHRFSIGWVLFFFVCLICLHNDDDVVAEDIHLDTGEPCLESNGTLYDPTKDNKSQCRTLDPLRLVWNSLAFIKLLLLQMQWGKDNIQLGFLLDCLVS